MQKNKQIAVIGGGVAGSTIALKLSELKLNIQLFEASSDLVNGPPVCHLHAGGSLYRELSDEHCRCLLRQSIETVRAYEHCIKVRPTVIAVPTRDAGEPLALLPRLSMLQQHYRDLVASDEANEVLGKAEDYFQVFEREQVEALKQRSLPKKPSTPEDWLIPLAKELDLDKLKYPLVLVQEYGVSLFRVAATVKLACEQQKNIQVHKRCKVCDIQAVGEQWQIHYQDPHGQEQCQLVDYVVNACGFRTGMLDDMLGVNKQRMVEFKAAYVSQWPQCKGHWPEVVFHGERGTENGMAQLTPYGQQHFQLHGMSKDITLFEDGLVASSAHSAQPLLPSALLNKIQQGWPEPVMQKRTQNAIEHLAYFIPSFANAQISSKPLFGAQQIPGADPNFRTGGASFPMANYARSEIVKLSSALDAANDIKKNLQDLGHVAAQDGSSQILKATSSLDRAQVLKLAEQIATERGYPSSLVY